VVTVLLESAAKKAPAITATAALETGLFMVALGRAGRPVPRAAERRHAEPPAERSAVGPGRPSRSNLKPRNCASCTWTSDE
jgi:hypothetical protein